MTSTTNSQSASRAAALHRFFRFFAAQSPHAILLEGTGEVSDLSRWVLMGFQPRQVLYLKDNQLAHNGRTYTLSSPEELFAFLRKAFEDTRCHENANNEARPFSGGLMGYFGYEFSRWCEPALFKAPKKRATSVFPDMLLCEFSDWLLLDAQTGALEILCDDNGRKSEYLRAWENPSATAMEPAATVSRKTPTPREDYLGEFRSSFTESSFAEAVDGIKRRIEGGEIYQANLSMRLEKQIALDPFAVYERLCAANPSPFSGFLQFPEGAVLCNSPERLVQVDRNGQVQTRPIAGTRGRGADASEDAAIGETLRGNEKERAEHLMLVDLERNDLGRVCLPGSVQVNELLVLERYSHVTHLVSNVQGQLAPGRDAWDVLKALFPGGTITGCPKIRSMEILSEFEPVPRGPYTGSLGYVDGGTGAMDLNILIRSLYLERLTGFPTGATASAGPFVYNTAIHVGAGIVADSVGSHEYRECLRKAAAMLGVLQAYEQGSESGGR